MSDEDALNDETFKAEQCLSLQRFWYKCTPIKKSERRLALQTIDIQWTDGHYIV